MMGTVGLLMGTFDPPHLGHVYAACKAANLVDEVAIIPAYTSPWKEKALPYSIRSEMCKNAFPYYRMRVWELDRHIRSKNSYEFLKVLLDLKLPLEYKIVCGSDVDITKWYNGEWIAKNFDTIVVPRQEFDCSSTKIREMFKARKDPRPFITQEVFDIAKDYYK